MRLTVLGSAASYPGPGQACTGHLVQSGDSAVLLDCGPGVLSNLGRVTDPMSLGAVFVSHRHPDHFLDVYGLQAFLRYAPSGPAGTLPLFGPPLLFDRMKSLLDDRGARELEEAFSYTIMEPGDAIEVGGVTVLPLHVDHVGDTFALRVTAAGCSTTVCYTSDCRYGEDVIAAARGSNVLLAEATLPSAYAGLAPHMTAGEAGRLASEVGAELLVLDHLWPTADREELLADAQAAFGGEILLAEEFMTIDLP